MKKNSFTYDELISCGNGELFGPGNAKLPLPPMLMFDRITEINEDNGGRGNFALPGPKSSPFPQLISSSYVNEFFFINLRTFNT